jgi:hypothetical protein
MLSWAIVLRIHLVTLKLMCSCLNAAVTKLLPVCFKETHSRTEDLGMFVIVLLRLKLLASVSLHPQLSQYLTSTVSSHYIYCRS